ncbi:insulinase family protein [Shewanella sp. C32]|uniref:Insulinase family protein n=1 Tax=Shewanella electrica TaxID=515560 RepID=A0ABT2FG48_9GAMM|nr:pitrilysin family protein [Shewanella electrica]MCH1925073.1 insulinase family protein [Shewanella electrica]MCS4554897.1 insulinase family protein [Shewanella electrica]
MTFRLRPLSLIMLSASLMACSATPTNKQTPATALDANYSSTVPAINIEYEKFVLPNGLTTIVHTDHSVPKVFVGIWYKVGSKDEPEGKTGFAHLFEHLMFQGTANRKGDYFLPYNKVGATGINGTTDLDRTNYYATIPSNAIDTALWMESDRMAYLAGAITQDALNEQRDVVKNEKRQGQLRPGSETSRRYQTGFYPVGHPYAHSTIGSMEDLDNASLDDVKQWFKDYYGASNAVLVLSGDIDVATAKEKVSHYFSDAPAGKPNSKIDQWVPTFSEVKRDINYDQVATVNFSRTWPLPNSEARDTSLMEVVAATLAGSKDSPLNRVLIDELQLALGVSANVTSNEVSSTFSISAALKPGVSVEDVDAHIQKILADYFDKGPDQERLDGLRLSLDISLIRSLESAEGVGNRLAEGEVFHDNPAFFEVQRDWLKETNGQELKTVAKKWLSKPYFESQIRPMPRVQDMNGKVDRSAIPHPGKFDGKVVFPDIQQATLANGMKVVVSPRPSLPVVDISMQFATGTALNNKYGTSVAELAFGLMSQGTTNKDVNAIAKTMEKTGTTIAGAASERQSGVNWGPLTQYLDPTFALAADLIRNPIYPQAEIDKIVDRVDMAYDNYERNPMGSGGVAYNRAIWGADHRFGHVPTREEDKALSRDAIVKFHDNEIVPNNATLYMVGDITLERGVELANRYFGDWKAGTPAPLPGVEKAHSMTGKVILVDAPGMVQSSIMVGHVVTPYTPETAATYSLMSDALGGGFNSRLNMNLREDKGWAYGFGADISSASIGERVFTASGTVQADKTAESMKEVAKEIREFVTTRPITAEELERDKESAIRSIPSRFTSNGSFVNSMITSQLYNLPYKYAEGAMERMNEVTLEDVRKLAKATYHPDQLTWVVVGDLSVIEKDIRALKLGEVEVWDVYGNKVR